MSWHAARQFVRRPPMVFKVIIFLAAVIAYATSGFMLFEKPVKGELDWLSALWWSMVTMTTVGYGDHFPSTNMGRFLVGFPAMLVGMGMLGFALSQAASYIIRAEALNRKGLTMKVFRDHILVCNFPSTGRLLRVLHELQSHASFADTPIVLVDEHLDELPPELARRGVHFVRGNPAREHVLRRASAEGAARSVVLARNPSDVSSDSQVIATCLSLTSLNHSGRTVAECVDPDNEEVVRRAGATGIVCVSNLAPGILANELAAPGIVDVLQELTVWGEAVNNIVIVPVELTGEAPRQTRDLRAWSEERGMTLLGIRSNDAVAINPPIDRPIASGDCAILVTREAIDRVCM